MENQEKNTLDDLLFANGVDSSEQGEISKPKPAKKKAKKTKSQSKKAKSVTEEVKAVADKPAKQLYSREDLQNKSSEQLIKICTELKISFIASRKGSMIKRILLNQSNG